MPPQTCPQINLTWTIPHRSFSSEVTLTCVEWQHIFTNALVAWKACTALVQMGCSNNSWAWAHLFHHENKTRLWVGAPLYSSWSRKGKTEWRCLSCCEPVGICPPMEHLLLTRSVINWVIAYTKKVVSPKYSPPAGLTFSLNLKYAYVTHLGCRDLWVKRVAIWSLSMWTVSST